MCKFLGRRVILMLVTTKLMGAAERLGLPTSPPYLSLASATNKTDSFLTGVSCASGGAGIIDGTAKIFASFKLFSNFLYIIFSCSLS